MEKLKNFYEKRKTLLILSLLAVAIVLPFLIDKGSVMSIIVKILFYVIMASSLNIINGYSGQFNIGHAGFVLIGAYTLSILANFGWPIWILYIVAGIVSSIIGLVIALPTLRLRGIYLALVTLGFSEILRLVALNWTGLTGGPMGIKGIPAPWFFGLRATSPHNYYFIVLIFVILCLFTSYRVINSKVGRAWMSIREDDHAAMSLGVNIRKYKAINFMFGAFWAGVGGALMAPFYTFIDSSMFTLDEGFNILSMVIIGGQGTLVGPVVGAIVVNLTTEIFRFANEARLLIYAVMIMSMMWIRPQGIAGTSRSVIANRSLGRNGGGFLAKLFKKKEVK
ncbi:MAG: branched-chain amino acid ABC transporter permease [Clostridiales bacterium]|nr:branched-chain amino acid ABC transporter permease [Clostridiales bacterium]